MSEPQPPLIGHNSNGQMGYAKAIIAGIAGASVTLIVTVWNQYAPHPLPSDAVGALQTIVTGLAVLFTPHNLFSGDNS